MISYIGTLRPPVAIPRGFHIAVNKSKNKAALFAFTITPLIPLSVFNRKSLIIVYFINFFPTLVICLDYYSLINYSACYLWYSFLPNNNIISHCGLLNFNILFKSFLYIWIKCVRFFTTHIKYFVHLEKISRCIIRRYWRGDARTISPIQKKTGTTKKL